MSARNILIGVKRFADANPITLTYVSDGDANGVFTFIGKNYLSVGAWTNPNTAGRLTINQTGNSFDAASTVVNHDTNTAGTGNESPSDWTFIFESGKSLLINKYSVQEPSPNNTSQPNGWQLQASNDGSAWTTLDTVASTGWSPTGAGAWLTQTVDPGGISYRYFRLHMHIGNQAGANSFFLVSEVELYGSFNY